ncbi:hypothetical protein E1298_09195 [Actinomadura rubrisoli]|uniref:Uncharacterized protein n=2 Tax=Actinomadura rubrisoli TaxID=2530368 RepID=A0A4R5C5X2_9ACTN|nr:hypothetical protein E1298_09195 [Actinomadura rubrisoli]
MADRQISQRKLAERVPCSDDYISRLARDMRAPSEQMAKRLDEILDAGKELIALYQAQADDAGSAGSVGGTNAHDLDEEKEMRRRRLLQALATFGVASTPVVEAIEYVRAAVDRAIGLDEDRHLEEWEETVAEYGYTYTTLPPHRLLTDLVADLMVVQASTSRSTAEERPDWNRVAGGMAVLVAKTLCNLDQSRLAREWWITAQHAADASGDRDLSLWVSGERLMHGLYDERPPVILLRKANRIVERASSTPCRGLASVRTVRAQLLAIDGPPRAAANELRACEEIFERLPASVTADAQSLAGWAEYRQRYTEAWVHARTGDREQLDAAVACAKQILPANKLRVHAQLDLLRAAGHVRAGDATEGVRHAHAVYAAHPPEQCTTLVTSLARQVADAVPGRGCDATVFAAYRGLLESRPEPRAVT